MGLSGRHHFWRHSCFSMAMSELSLSDQVFVYHRRTKHRFDAYAAGPPALDWDAQPAPFRHYAGAPVVRLPLATEASVSLQAALRRPWRGWAEADAAPLGVESIGVLLNLSLAITAWKSYGPSRWALRANPSSGNLHPVEAYVIATGIDGLADGVYHYCPDDHALECRAAFAVAPAVPMLAIGLSTAMWREAWKYGERAFRYCQLDVGHAVAAIAYAVSALGWTLHERRELATLTLARLLGVDRVSDFPSLKRADTEREEAEVLLQVAVDGGLASIDAQALLAGAHWQGSASTIDPAPVHRWPIIDEVAAATRRAGHKCAEPRQLPPRAVSPISEQSAGSPLADVTLGRRSAQRFDPRASLAASDFFAILAAAMPGAEVPWLALAEAPRVSLVLFVHRVDGLDPGLYLLARKREHRAPLAGRFRPEPVATAPAGLPFYRLTTAEPQELRRLARAIHCQQDLAANACFALGMVAEFSAPIAADPAAYRDLFREAGAIGQVLYLEAEACGLRGTGIGCFFDDPFHELLGLAGEDFQTIYHFTVGLPVDDARLETSPAYPNR
jgi:SagB-type dehydrogenase family enzyme